MGIMVAYLKSGRRTVGMEASSRSSGNVVVSSKSESLIRALSDVDFDNRTILDAGTGVWSARFLARRAPDKIVGVVGPGDYRKEAEARNVFQSMGYSNYQLISGNLICDNLFPADAFDFILADGLIEEVDSFAPLGICRIFRNFYIFLRGGGELAIVNAEAHPPFCPVFRLTSTHGIQGEMQLNKRNNRDLIDAIHLLLSTALTLKLLFPLTFACCPSEWICNWLIDAGFREVKRYLFDVKVPMEQEFAKRYTSTRQIISTIHPLTLREGLLHKLEEIASEYKRRDAAEDDCFLQRHYIIRAKK